MSLEASDAIEDGDARVSCESARRKDDVVRLLELDCSSDGRNFELWTHRDEGAEAVRDCAAGFLVSTMPRV